MNAVHISYFEVIEPIDHAPFAVGDTLTIDHSRGLNCSWVLVQHQGFDVVLSSSEAATYDGLTIAGGVIAYKRPDVNFFH